MKNPRRKPAAGGFSLIELLIAAVILALTGSLMVGGLIAANRSAERRAEQALLTQQLASQIALLPDQVPPDAPPHGACPQLPGGAACDMEQGDAAPMPLKQVTLTLGPGDRPVRAATLRAIAEP